MARAITESQGTSARVLIDPVVDDDEQLLSQLTQLSDAEIDSLYSQELLEGENNS
jgi:hypothetical protein